MLIQMQPQFVQIIQQQESQFLDSRGTLLLIKTLSIPAGFKLWLEAEVEGAKVSLIKLELDRWMSHLNTRFNSNRPLCNVILPHLCYTWVILDTCNWWRVI